MCTVETNPTFRVEQLSDRFTAETGCSIGRKFVGSLWFWYLQYEELSIHSASSKSLSGGIESQCCHFFPQVRFT